MTLLNKFLTNIIAIKIAVYASLVCGLLFSFFGDSLSFIPLASVGFGWVIPTLIALIIGLFIRTNKTP